MGTAGSKSQTVVNDLQKQINSIALKTVQNCGTFVNQIQQTSIIGNLLDVGNSYTVKQGTTVNSSCTTDSKVLTDLQTQIAAAITNAASANNVALAGVLTSAGASANTSLQQVIENYVSTENIQNNYNNIIHTQQVKYKSAVFSLFNTIDITQGAEVYANAVVQSVMDSHIVDALAAHIDNSATATQTNPLDFLGNIEYIIIAFIALIVVIVLVATLGGHSSSGSTMIPYGRSILSM